MSKDKSAKNRLKAIKKRADKIRKNARARKIAKRTKRTAIGAIERMLMAAERYHEMSTYVL